MTFAEIPRCTISRWRLFRTAMGAWTRKPQPLVAAYQTVSGLIGRVYGLSHHAALALTKIAAWSPFASPLVVWIATWPPVGGGDGGGRGEDPKSLVLVIADTARSHPADSTPFVLNLRDRYKGKPCLALPLTWIEASAGRVGSDHPNSLCISGNQQQAATQVPLANSIGSLRALGVMDLARVRSKPSVSSSTRCVRIRLTPTLRWISLPDRYRHVIETCKNQPALRAEVAAQRNPNSARAVCAS